MKPYFLSGAIALSLAAMPAAAQPTELDTPPPGIIGLAYGDAICQTLSSDNLNLFDYNTFEDLYESLSGIYGEAEMEQVATGIMDDFFFFDESITEDPYNFEFFQNFMLAIVTDTECFKGFINELVIPGIQPFVLEEDLSLEEEKENDPSSLPDEEPEESTAANVETPTVVPGAPNIAPTPPDGWEISTTSGAAELDLVAYLNEIDAKMYGAFWCPYCYLQKQLFGAEASSQIPYVECAPNGINPQTEACIAAGVSGFPTWEINGELYSGSQPLDRLGAFAGYEGSTDFRYRLPSR